MDHRDFKKEVVAALYVAEVLEDPQFGEFCRHLDECEECRGEVAYWSRGLDAFEGIRRFIAAQCERRLRRRSGVLLMITFAGGGLSGAIAVLAYECLYR